MNRRMFVRNAATTLWLPFLPSLAPRAAWATAPVTPRRSLWWFVPNGLVTDYVTPTTEGAGYALPYALEPLAAIQSRVSVISGLSNRADESSGLHEECMGTLLGDNHIDNTFNGTLDGGTSVDQHMAKSLGSVTPFGSLQLSLDEPYIAAGGSNIDVLYRTLSFASPTTPIAPLGDPRTVFDRMFAGVDTSLTEVEIEARRNLRKSLLDSVLDRTNALSAKASAVDKQKLDQYITGVREVEQRIDQLAEVVCPTPDEPSANPGYQERMFAMIDLMVVALQCDYTRVITFMAGASTCLTVYDFLGIGADHHTLSHNWAFDTGAAQDLKTVYNYQVARFADLCAKLAAIPTDEGDLLSATTASVVTEFGESNFHQADPVTYLFAGGEDSGIVQGKHRRFTNAPHSNLWINTLNHMNVDATGYGTTWTGPFDLTT
ncbi:MAG: DUF1552 domain-containing protein [Myxococcota bacterium]